MYSNDSGAVCGRNGLFAFFRKKIPRNGGLIIITENNSLSREKPSTRIKPGSAQLFCKNIGKVERTFRIDLKRKQDPYYFGKGQHKKQSSYNNGNRKGKDDYSGRNKKRELQ